MGGQGVVKDFSQEVAQRVATIIVSIAPVKCADERRNVFMHAFFVVTEGTRA